MTPQEAIHFLKETIAGCHILRDRQLKEVCITSINAIEKQISKFVLCPKGFQGVRDTRYYCPSCNSLTRQHEAFCHKCGQAVKYPKEVYVKAENKIVLDWSDTE